MLVDINLGHLFGAHDVCGDWCGYRANPSGYKHKNLPRGKDLSDARLHEELKKIFLAYEKNSEKLAAHGSSQRNESLNSVVASKAPKAKHYGSSDSLDFRIAGAVCQTNLGRTYVPEVCKSVGISPGQCGSNGLSV